MIPCSNVPAEAAKGVRRVRWLRAHWLSLVLRGIAALSAVGAFVVGVEVGAASGRRRTVLLAVGATLTAAGILLAALEGWRRDRARRTALEVALDAEENLTLTLNGALAPLTSYLGELATTGSRADRHALAGQIRQAVVDAAVTLTGPRSRSAFYELHSDDALDRAVYAGRATEPRERFLAGTPDGDFVLGLVARGELVFVDDVAVHPIVQPSAPGYGTVIAVAVTAGPKRFGLLTVDAPRPGDLSPTDVELVRVLGNLLGCGLAQA
jgi:hypothetical protein